jgi:hypothetical protein
MKTYHITWEIDVDADTPREAAETAFGHMQRLAQRRPCSMYSTKPVSHAAWICQITKTPPRTTRRNANSGGGAIVANRIEVLQWRELFDDEDTLGVSVLAADDATSAEDVVIAENETGDEYPLSFDYDNADAVPHPCTVINTHIINDGDTLVSHDGRTFIVSITEVKQGNSIRWKSMPSGMSAKCSVARIGHCLRRRNWRCWARYRTRRTPLRIRATVAR